jgi:hypothetical protein
MTGTLPVALRRFSELLTVVLPSDELRADLRLYELVVLQSRAVEAVENAKRLVTSGGYLYWEVERITQFGRE